MVPPAPSAPLAQRHPFALALEQDVPSSIGSHHSLETWDPCARTCRDQDPTAREDIALIEGIQAKSAARYQGNTRMICNH